MKKTCTKCGDEKTVEDFYALPSKNFRRMSQCKTCVSVRGAVHYRLHPERWKGPYREARKAKIAADSRLKAKLQAENIRVMRARAPLMKERQLTNRLEVIKHLGGVCINCGWKGHHAGFEFDHTNPETKTVKFSKLLRSSEKYWAPELHKLQLLCGTCHNIKTYEEGSLSRGNRNPIQRIEAVA